LQFLSRGAYNTRSVLMASYRVYRVSQKSDTLFVFEFPVLLDVFMFAIFVYSGIVFKFCFWLINCCSSSRRSD